MKEMISVTLENIHEKSRELDSMDIGKGCSIKLTGRIV
jgi:hypothetical protein